MKVLGIIPARFASTRFPGKPLVVINGKTMIQRVYEQALKAESLSKVVVATDDERIFNHVESFGGEVIMTSSHHQSGTDRCAEVIDRLNTEAIQALITPHERWGDFFDIVVNIQGDEPFIDPTQIDKVVEVLKKGDFMISTLVKRIEDADVIQNPNVVKAVFTEQGKAIYFSRSPIPYLRNIPQYDWLSKGELYKHLGLYAYKSDILKALAALQPSRLEQLESLEQLRWIENGYTIGVAKTNIETIGVDTPDDILKLGKSNAALLNDER